MAVAFDTPKLARRPEAAGFTTRQAQDTAETLTANLATRSDIQKLRDKIREVELTLRADMAAMRAELIKWVAGIGVAGVPAIGGIILTARFTVVRSLGHG